MQTECLTNLLASEAVSVGGELLKFAVAFRERVSTSLQPLVINIPP